ncbi:MAG: FtsX-like permease family protein, partial [Anaerolineales bacterium]|nr:FtsX-like permease family protein [Anaerolineales bacterium]
MHSLAAFARRNLAAHRVRTVFSATAVSLGTATLVAADVISAGLIDTEAGGDNVFANFIAVMDVILYGVGVVILLAAGFLIFNAFAMTVTQRRQQLGLLRALGMTRRQVVRQLLLEAWLTGGAGTLAGLLLGPPLGFAILQLLRLLGLQPGRGQLHPLTLLAAAAISLTITTLSVYLPARRAAHTPPITALFTFSENAQVLTVNSQFSINHSPLTINHLPLTLNHSPFLFLPLLLIYLILAPPGAWTGLHHPWQYLLPWLLILVWLGGLALLLPLLLARLQRMLHGRFSHPILRLAADSLGRDPRRAALTALTFAVGVAMILGGSGILTFMNEVLLKEAASGLLAETVWFIHPYDNLSGLGQLAAANQDAGLDPAVQADVHRTVGARGIVGEQYFALVPEIAAPIAGFPSAMNDVDALQGTTYYTFVEGDWETAAPIMRAGCGLLLPPVVAAQHDVGVGDPLTVTGKDGPVACTVAGIGYGGATPVSIISLAAKDAFVDGPPTTLAVRPAPGADPVALQDDLQALADRHGSRAWLSTPQQELDGIIGVSDQLEGLANGFLLLAILAAALGMVNTTMMSVSERRRELGTLRAIGATRRQLRRILVGEAALIGAIGGLVGLLTGAGMVGIYALAFGGI